MTPTMTRGLFACLAAMALGAGLIPLKAQAQPAAAQSIWDGVYTDAQAERGRGHYGQHCAVCHGPALEGSFVMPPLTGEFIADWTGTSLADLYDKIQTTMPLNAPGTLRPANTADILAYLLKVNNFPAGQKELGAAPGELGAISFDAIKPAAPSARGRRGDK
jgi:S-disulfanyl-L-cysteine oxidoreductase SoxD